MKSKSAIVALVVGVGIAAVAACTGTDPSVLSDPTNDASTDSDAKVSTASDSGGGSGGDGGPLPDTCGDTAFESAVQIFPSDAAFEDISVVLSSDERTIFVSRAPTAAGNPPPMSDFWTATRASRSDPFGELTRYDPFNSADEDYGLKFSPDGREAVISSSRFHYPRGELVGSFRTKPSDPFAATFTSLGLVDVDAGETSTGLAFVGDALYLAKGATLPTQRLYVATRASADFAYNPPTAVASVNALNAQVLSMTSDSTALTLYFGTDAVGTRGAMDIWRASRTSVTADFVNPVRVSDPLLNTDAWDEPGWLSADGCRFYTVSTRSVSGPEGNRHIWLASRTPHH